MPEGGRDGQGAARLRHDVSVQGERAHRVEDLLLGNEDALVGELREQRARNPLTVLPASPADAGPLAAEAAELVGNYAVRITFSDGHDTGIYSWTYLREIDPGQDPP